MNRTKIFAALSVAASLGAATTVANGAEPDTAQAPVQAAVAPGVPMTPVWVQLPAAGSYPYYLMPPQPVPPYPLPQMALPPGWGPFVMVWVPVQALQAWSVPPVVDYGPVMDTPVIVLPEPEPEPEPEPALAPAPAPAGVSPAGLAPAAPSELPVSEVDYGPIAPTPVVELPDFTAQPAVATPVKPPAKARKKPVSRKKSVSKAPAATAPAKKRMCWYNGVVEPCR